MVEVMLTFNKWITFDLFLFFFKLGNRRWARRKAASLGYLGNSQDSNFVLEILHRGSKSSQNMVFWELEHYISIRNADEIASK